MERFKVIAPSEVTEEFNKNYTRQQISNSDLLPGLRNMKVLIMTEHYITFLISEK
jgi:hypothetical protein